MPSLMNLGSLGSTNGLNPLVIDMLKNLTGQMNDLNCPSDVSTSTNSPTNGIAQTLFPTRFAFSSSTKSDLDFANLFQMISQMNTEMKSDLPNNTVDKEAASSCNVRLWCYFSRPRYYTGKILSSLVIFYRAEYFLLWQIMLLKTKKKLSSVFSKSIQVFVCRRLMKCFQCECF